VKVQPVFEPFRSVDRVREKADGQNRENHHREQNRDRRDDDSTEVTREKLGRAVDAFDSDAQARATGLHASVSGAGPGLKVILTDGTGVTIRQFTGEEFLKMREAAGLDNRGRGKILDQKL